jgi:beta-glucanase (GH16 family)
MPFPSFLLGFSSILSTALATQYSQQEVYTGKNWLDAFHFTTQDFNDGFVDYVSEVVAKDTGLYKVVGDDVMFGVDAKETLDYTKATGRKSVKLEGNRNYNKGLFILDVKAMPGVCGMWPAFWSLGEEPWPVKGEVRRFIPSISLQ